MPASAPAGFVTSVVDDTVAYPPTPWQMVGSMWLTVFRLGRDADERHPAGIYGAAFVAYEEGSPLTYSELLVARPVSGSRRVTITDIWVDSPASVAGGRELWAIPKELCHFTRIGAGSLPARTSWTAADDAGPIAAARFTDVSGVAPKLPFKGGTWQAALTERPADAGEKTATLQGRSRSLPARAHWTFDVDGPLAFLRDARQLGSVRMADFEMSFG